MNAGKTRRLATGEPDCGGAVNPACTDCQNHMTCLDIEATRRRRGAMGAVIGSEEKELEEIKGLSEDARGVIAHHFRNSLQNIISGIALKNPELIKETVRHMEEDLVRMGC